MDISVMETHETLHKILNLQCFEPIDRHFARLIVRLAGDNASESLAIAALMASSRTAHGDICARLEAAAGRHLGEVVRDITGVEEPECPGIQLPQLAAWSRSLEASGVVASADGQGKVRSPLVLDGDGNLFMYRYWQYEMIIDQWIRQRVDTESELLHEIRDRVNTDLLRESLNRLFGKTEEYDWQKLAAASGVLRPFTVITGGPGTGKTTTVVKMLSLMIEQFLDKDIIPAIALAAPTGKAAGRMKETIKQQREHIQCGAEVMDIIPGETYTLHRLLGTVRGKPHFRHHEKNPLPYDVVIVDESSMVDVALMAKLMKAMPARGSLVLVGDRDQLASVEAGAVLGDICDSGHHHGYTVEWNKTLEAAKTALPGEYIENTEPHVADSVIMLRKNYRFGSDSGIGRFSNATRESDVEDALTILEDRAYGDISLQSYNNFADLRKLLEALVTEGFKPYLHAKTPGESFMRYGGFTVLTPFRTGPFGIETLNYLAEKILHKAELISGTSQWYSHRPVMITVNDYSLMLYNGDVGIVLPEDPAGQRKDIPPVTWFQEPGGTFRSISPSRLHNIQTSYAMTVHKSQGSEFDHVVLVLPPALTGNYERLLTRELLYTAVTRARSRVTILGKKETVSFMIGNPTMRASGLRDLLWE